MIKFKIFALILISIPSISFAQTVMHTKQIETNEKDIMYCIGFIELAGVTNDPSQKAELEHMDKMVIQYINHNGDRLDIPRSINTYGEEFKSNLQYIMELN